MGSRMLYMGLPALLVVGCAEKDNRVGDDADDGVINTVSGAEDEEASDDAADEEESTETTDGNCPPGGCLDTLPAEGETGMCGESDQCGTCEAPEHVSCDGMGSIATALGLNCDGEPQVEIVVNGNPEAAGIKTGFGTMGTWDPTEGTEFVAIGSGFVADLDFEGYICGPDMLSGCCSRDLDIDFNGTYDPGTMLPPPIVLTDVGAVNCAEDDTLVGTGDCSNSLQEQFAGTAGGANDYTEIRITGTVPEGVSSFSYDFAFFSYEWPGFWQSSFNDIYIGWLESELWTGNISFDSMGNPISVNAGFFDYLDSDTYQTDDMGLPHPICPDGAGCTAPELHGTCMTGHGGTRWLTTTASVVPGEEFTLVLAAMDLGDSILDSYAFIDNFQWGCDPEQPPTTVPID